MPKGTTFANAVLRWLFNGDPIVGLCDNAAISALTAFYISLHTASPAGTSQLTHEITYTGYGRIAVARTNLGWAVVGQQASNIDDINFGASSSVGQFIASHAGIGTLVSGAGMLLYQNAIAIPNGGLIINTGSVPQIVAGDCIATEQ